MASTLNNFCTLSIRKWIPVVDAAVAMNARVVGAFADVVVVAVVAANVGAGQRCHPSPQVNTKGCQRMNRPAMCNLKLMAIVAREMYLQARYPVASESEIQKIGDVRDAAREALARRA
jgi:hypothetical protein